VYATRVQNRTSSVGATCQSSDVLLSTRAALPPLKRFYPRVANHRLLPQVVVREGSICGQLIAAEILSAMGRDERMGR
jgi:hypothetical protein